MSCTPADATTTATTTEDGDTATPVHPATGSRSPGLSRRAVVAGAGAVAGIGVLTACGGSATAPAAPAAAPEPATPGSAQAPAGGGSASAAAPAGGALAAVTDIPVGGGTVFPDKDVVVTQPTAGDFKAFSATCTHRGCKVNAVADGAIKCPCHASNFAIADGAVLSGPAQTPLPAKTITVEGEEIVLA